MIGQSDLAEMSSAHLGRPLGGLLIVAVISWLIVHQVLNSERFYFRGYIQAACVIFLVLVVGLGASAIGQGVPLFLSPVSEIKETSASGLYPLGIWSDILGALFLCGFLGSGFIGQMLMQDGRTRDPWRGPVAMAMVILVFMAVLWLVIVGIGIAYFNYSHVGRVSSPSSIELLLLQTPIGLYTAAGAGAWGNHLNLTVLGLYRHGGTHRCLVTFTQCKHATAA